jgi:hypothetical protein
MGGFGVLFKKCALCAGSGPVLEISKAVDVPEMRIWTLYSGEECIISKGRFVREQFTRISSSKTLVNHNDGLLHCKKS